MNHAVIFCVEKGLLESQSLLLINSFKKFSTNRNLNLFAFSPRKEFQPSEQSLNFFKKNKVTHIKVDLNTKFLQYPIANKILTCSYFEKNIPEYQSIMFVDTDTVLLNDFGLDKFTDKGIYLKPVGHKGPGTEGSDDANDDYWKKVFSLFEINLPAVKYHTTIKGIPIRGYFNAGLVWSNRVPNFFQQWEQDFLKLIDSGLTPPGFISKDQNNFRCLDQVALAVTASRYSDYLHILPPTYNHHIPFRPLMEKNSCPRFDELVHVHYHKWFQHPGFLDHVTSDEEKQSEQYKWLKERLPLQPEIDGPFKC